MSEQGQIPEPQKPDASKVPARAGRGLRLALALSVALNLGVAGLVAGFAWHGGPGGRGEMLRELGFGPFEGGLRPEDRLAMRSALRSHLGEIRAARRQMGEDISAILAALRADPFSSEALTQAMAVQAGHMGDRLAFGSDMLRDHLLSLDDAARHDFAARMEAQLHRGPDGPEDAD
jgi:Heavy-metal resistance